MQTTPHPERTSTPTQFSATFENQDSGTIYNTRYMLAIGKQTQCVEMQLIEYSAQSNDFGCSFEMHTTTHSARTSAPTQFSATFENQGSGTIYNTKYMLAIGPENTMW